MGAAPVPPLTCSVGLSFSSGTDNVSGASGDLYSATGGTHLVGMTISGGSGSYSMVNLAFASDGNQGSSNAFMADAGDVFHHYTIFWSGAAVGNFMTYHLTLDVTDDQGNTASARWPSAGSATIQRVS